MLSPPGVQIGNAVQHYVGLCNDYIDRSIAHDRFTIALVKYLIGPGGQVTFVLVDKNHYMRDLPLTSRVIAAKEHETSGAIRR